MPIKRRITYVTSNLCNRSHPFCRTLQRPPHDALERPRRIHQGLRHHQGTTRRIPPNSTVDATIDATSINTRDDQRDGHLKSADFLDVEKFPTITFHSKQIQPHDGDGGKVTGDLTIHGVTREITLDVEGPDPEIKDPWGKQRVGASATAKLSRKDFGLIWNAALETGGVMVGDEVKITIDVEAVRD